MSEWHAVKACLKEARCSLFSAINVQPSVTVISVQRLLALSFGRKWNLFTNLMQGKVLLRSYQGHDFKIISDVKIISDPIRLRSFQSARQSVD